MVALAVRTFIVSERELIRLAPAPESVGAYLRHRREKELELTREQLYAAMEDRGVPLTPAEAKAYPSWERNERKRMHRSLVRKLELFYGLEPTSLRTMIEAEWDREAFRPPVAGWFVPDTAPPARLLETVRDWEDDAVERLTRRAEEERRLAAEFRQREEEKKGIPERTAK